PRPSRPAEDRRQHYRAENTAVMATLEDLRRDGTHDRGETVAQRALCDDHRIEQRRRREIVQQDERQSAKDKAGIADGPHPFTPDPVGQMAKGDLPRDRDEAYQPQGPGRLAGAETDLDQVFRL